MVELRNAAITAELERAISRRTYSELFVLLCRFSGLPSPRANEKLAWAVAHAVAAYGSRADGLVRELCSSGRGRTPERGTVEFLPIVGVFCLAARVLAGTDPEVALAELRPLSEDPRHLIRESVERALAEMGHGKSEEIVALLTSWMDGYLSASVALEAATARTWLDALRSPDEILARLDETFALLEDAPRADQRSQGFRTLLKVMPEASARLMDRFPDAMVVWLESKAATDHVELREALGDLIVRIRAHGHTQGKLESFERQFAESAPPRRDPKTYVGPTRKRGARRR
jgi:hypothetical protein